MSVWHVWTDGSCQSGPHPRLPRSGYGGWAAIVEHGSDGFVLRGRAARTTNVRMELVAVIEGLRALPAGASVCLHTDSMAVVAAKQRWEAGGLRRAHGHGADEDLWLLLARELERVLVTVELVLKGDRAARIVHRRAHVIAGAESRAALAGMPSGQTPLTQDDRRILRQGSARRLRPWRDRASRVYGLPLPGDGF